MNKTRKTKRPQSTRKNKKLSSLLKKDAWADYAVESLKPQYIVYRFDDRQGNRFYYFKDKEDHVLTAVGITTAFGIVSVEEDHIEKWKEQHINWRELLNASSSFGTLEHMLYGEILLKKGVSKVMLTSMKELAVNYGHNPDMPAKDTISFLKFQEDYNLIPLLIEAKLILHDSQTDQYLAMTIDLLAKMIIKTIVPHEEQDGVYQRGEKKGRPKMIIVKEEVTTTEIVLVDFKSNFFEKEKKGFYETHKMQLMGGKLAVEQNFGITVDKVFNYAPNNWRKNPDYTLYEHKLTDKDWKVFYAYWNLIVAKEINIPSGNIFVGDTFKDSSDFKLLSYQEYAESMLLSVTNPEKTDNNDITEDK